MAAPKLPKGERRDHNIRILLTTKERRELLAAARRAGLSMGAFVRSIVLAAARQEHKP